MACQATIELPQPGSTEPHEMLRIQEANSRRVNLLRDLFRSVRVWGLAGSAGGIFDVDIIVCSRNYSTGAFGGAC